VSPNNRRTMAIPLAAILLRAEQPALAPHPAVLEMHLSNPRTNSSILNPKMS
jgi:hypothetical protein